MCSFNTRPVLTALVTIAALGAGLAGCAGDKLATAPDGALAARGDAGSRAPAGRPIAGSCVLSVTPISVTPPIVRQTDTGTCQLSHLGKTAYAGVLELNLAAGTQRGERTLTAANGDVLRMVSVGTSQPSGPGLVSFSATLTFVGGTGRFANATGQARGEGTSNLVTRTTNVALEGWIDYDASDRSDR
jgi:hypothetical protein